VNDDTLALILLASKPLMYAWLLAIPRLWYPRESRPSRWVPVVAALARVALGLIIGLPAALFLFNFDPLLSTLGLGLVRFALWTVVTEASYRQLSWTRILLFAAGATTLNVIFDYTLFRGHWSEIGFC
jgi:hypothetical protein